LSSISAEFDEPDISDVSDEYEKFRFWMKVQKTGINFLKKDVVCYRNLGFINTRFVF